MKQLIVLVSTILLGIAIFLLIAGPGDKTLKASITKLWQHEITEQSNIYP